MVETTGITGNYTNDLLTLETGYRELTLLFTADFWMAPCRNIVMNAAITGLSVVIDSVIYRSQLWELKKFRRSLKINDGSPMNISLIASCY